MWGVPFNFLALRAVNRVDVVDRELAGAEYHVHRLLEAFQLRLVHCLVQDDPGLL